VNDLQYRSLPRPSGGLDHGYGPRVHILSEPYPMSMLARLCAETTVQPQVNDLVGALYDWMLAEVSSALLLTTPVELPTRMARYHPAEGVYRGEAIDRGQRVVVVDIARAGILPSHRMYHGLHHLIEAENLRQDHIVSSLAHPVQKISNFRTSFNNKERSNKTNKRNKTPTTVLPKDGEAIHTQVFPTLPGFSHPRACQPQRQVYPNQQLYHHHVSGETRQRQRSWTGKRSTTKLCLRPTKHRPEGQQS
jgi:hypothetical protein